MTRRITAVFRAWKRRTCEAIGSLLTPADGIAPVNAGTREPPVAGMPESSAQGSGSVV